MSRGLGDVYKRQETYYSEKDDHIYITEEIELTDLKNKLDDENAVIFKVRG